MALSQRPAFRYAPVGACIYCKSKNPPLDEEHIVPYALGGNLILPKASCRTCSAITHKYEGALSRDTLGALRMRFGFPTRRKKERPAHIEIGTIDAAGRRGRGKVPVDEYPIGALLPSFGRAGLFLGAPSSLDVLRHRPTKVFGSGDLNSFKEKYSWDGTLQFRWVPIQFARAIIKMCYAQAIAETGLCTFEPLCLDQILSRDVNVSYVFGQSGDNEERSVGVTNVWEIGLELRLFNDRLLLIASCSIMPGLGTPIYEVVVGHVSSEHQINRLNAMFKDGKLVVISGDPS